MHRRAVSAAEFSGQLAEELGLVRIKTDYDAHHLMGHIPAHHLAFGPVGPHVAVHNLQQLGVADVGVAGRMHCANLFVAEFDTNRALAFCQNQVQDFFEAAAIVLSQQFIAVETNHATVVRFSPACSCVSMTASVLTFRCFAYSGAQSGSS